MKALTAERVRELTAHMMPTPKRPAPTVTERILAKRITIRNWRQRNIEKGLRVDGRPRVNKRWPELHGLQFRGMDRRIYKTLWNKLRKEQLPAAKTP